MKNFITAVVAILATTAFGQLAFAADQEMDLGPFSKVVVNAPVNLDVSVGKAPSFTMKGRDADLEKIIVKVTNDTLIIKKKKNSGSIRKVDITIAMKDLTKFVINGSSDTKIRDINADAFELGINGSGNVNLTGKSDDLDVNINGSGNVVSEKYDAGKVKAEINGSGNINLSGKCQDLDLDISGSGNFSGRRLTCASVKSSISGSGDAVIFASAMLKVRSSGNSDIEVYGHPKTINSKSSGNSELIIHGDK